MLNFYLPAVLWEFIVFVPGLSTETMHYLLDMQIMHDNLSELWKV